MTTYDVGAFVRPQPGDGSIVMFIDGTWEEVSVEKAAALADYLQVAVAIARGEHPVQQNGGGHD